MKKVTVAILFLCLCLIYVSSCSSKTVESSSERTTDVYKFLGEYAYDSPLVAFVYEPVEGEDESGIQYRKVTDIDGLMRSGVTLLLYFTSSMSTDMDGITAGAEDIAQNTWGKVIVLMIDVLENKDLASQFNIEQVPEFVIVRSSGEISRFEGYNHDIWTINEVTAWLKSNGIEV